MTRQISITGICAVLALSASTVLAQGTIGVGVNFVGNGGTAIPAGDSAGFFGQTNWNNVTGASGTGISLINANGAAAGISLDFRGSATGTTGAFGTNPLNNDTDYNRFTNNGAATGPQDGAAELWSGSLRHRNGFEFDPEPVRINLTGLSNVFSSYDVLVYFGNPGDQGDHYLVEFDAGGDDFTPTPWLGTTAEATQAPAVSAPGWEGNGQSLGGRSIGNMYGYNDNGTLMGGSVISTTMWAGSRANDSFAVSSDYIGNDEHLFVADEMEIRFWDGNNNHNGAGSFGADGLDHNWGGIDFQSGQNWGPFADAGVVGFQIVGTPIVSRRSADLTGDGFVDFDDLTILLAHWDSDEGAGSGNLVDPLGTRIDFQDLTFLLADWTGPGPAGSPEAASGTEAVPEPSSLLLVLMAACSLSVCSRRRRRRG